ncbi:MAG: DUF5009 domain-containing protein [Bacteroidales bacterium]|nr:DUF5009 domain-containing protein [Bacteroidales bacterium]
MNRRVGAIDALRGLTIFLMILCAAIGHGSGLPAWMFHCQTPPPDYAFHPEVRGITWVDMVFPIFIFSLGAAIPFWLGRRLEKGDSLPSVAVQVVKRFIVLVCFSFTLGHGSAIEATSCPQIMCGVVQFALWLCLFAALVRTQRHWLNAAGWAAAVGIFLWMHFSYGLEFDWKHNDCIITLLAWVVLMGGFVWLATRDDFRWRMAVILAVVLAKFFGLGFVQYLVIALPATMVGDILKGTDAVGAAPRAEAGRRPQRFGLTAFVALAAVGIQFWGLYTRHVPADLGLTLALAAAFALASRDALSRPARCGAASQTALMGFALLLAGICFDFVDGGIAKDHCNLSYLFATGGMSALLLYFLLWVESRAGLSRLLVLSGRNPMIAYTIAWSVICPILFLTGFQGWFDGLCAGPHPWLGLLRGLIIAFITTGVTCVFTKLEIFWKS